MNLESDATPLLGDSPCSLDSVCQKARHERLIWGLITLSSWCSSRASGQHDDATTITMLERKTRELVISIDEAGWKAISDHISANDQEHLQREGKS